MLCVRRAHTNEYTSIMFGYSRDSILLWVSREKCVAAICSIAIIRLWNWSFLTEWYIILMFSHRICRNILQIHSSTMTVLIDRWIFANPWCEMGYWCVYTRNFTATTIIRSKGHYADLHVNAILIHNQRSTAESLACIFAWNKYNSFFCHTQHEWEWSMSFSVYLRRQHTSIALLQIISNEICKLWEWHLHDILRKCLHTNRFWWFQCTSLTINSHARLPRSQWQFQILQLRRSDCVRHFTPASDHDPLANNQVLSIRVQAYRLSSNWW